MLFGCCGSIDQAAEVHVAGFDYLEAGVTSLRADEDDEIFAPILEKYQASPISIMAFNLFMPRDLKVVGPVVDEDRMKRYIRNAITRVQIIGAKTVVIGSGGSRSIPDGFSREEAMEQLVHFFTLIADVTDERDIIISIEPLNRKESNVINSVAEGVDIAQKVNRSSIRVLADFYHMDEDQEPLEEIVKYKDWLTHIHVADTGRGAPGTGQYPYDVFVDCLDKAGYDGLVSVECRWKDFAQEAPASVAFLRQTFSDSFFNCSNLVPKLES